MAVDERLALLAELERTDEAIGAELAELDELAAAADAIHERAVELEQLFARLPQEREVAAAAVEEADQALVAAQEALERAREVLAAAKKVNDPKRFAEARRFEVRARDHLHIGERKAAAAREHAAELESRGAAAQVEAAQLERRAQELADVLRRRPRLTDDAVAGPGSGLSGVAEWGTPVRAALLVARSQLAAEKEAVVRQANELGAVVLGEPVPALATREVVRRVEGTLADR
jgi:hypothetical protein